MLTATAYDTHVEQLFERDPLRARLTSDVDAAIERRQLPQVIAAAEKAGWTFRHTAGVNMLVDETASRARSAIHLLTSESASSVTADITQEGILIAPVADLVRMKLTSYRLKEIEAQLSDTLQRRLAETRASE